jgi:hypothetical protein
MGDFGMIVTENHENRTLATSATAGLRSTVLILEMLAREKVCWDLGVCLNYIVYSHSLLVLGSATIPRPYYCT